MLNRRSLFLGVFLISMPVLAMAQQDPNAMRARGTVQKVDAQSITIQKEDGGTADFHLTADTIFSHNDPSSLSAIKPGDFVASAARKGNDGKLHSVEVRIFPPAMAGLGEGQRLMQDKVSTMTNAVVSAIDSASDGQVLKVKFEGGESELVVGPDVPVVQVSIVKVDDVKVGGKVFVTATKAADGSFNATRVLAQ